jgi:cyclophilin family peptidyl-prolyl cis-trans isomerase
MTASFRFKELLSRCLPASPRRRRGVRTGWTALQALEARVLPAGNVQVTISGDQLIIRGDGEDNEISIIEDDGNLVVRGLNDTTINGEEDDFVVVEDGTTFEGRVVAKLGLGDDTFAIGDDVTINGQLFVEDFFGDDQISIDAASINGGIQIRTHYGNDSIRFNGTTISGATYLFTGFGDDLVVLDNVETSAYFRISAGPGDDGVDTDGNTFGGRFVTRLGFGADDANFDGDSVDEDWIVRSRRGDDAVRATNMLVEGSTLFRSTGGDDNYLLTGTNELTGRVLALFGPGTDNLEMSAGTETPGGITEKGVEDDETTDSVFTSRFDAANSGLMARADALRASIDGALTLTVNNPAGMTQSNGALLTKQQQFTVTGTTHADAVVTLDIDNDGFDDGTATANNDGTFTMNVSLGSSAVSAGVQSLEFRSTFGGGSTEKTIKVDVVVGTVVRFSTTLGNYDVEMLNSDAPATVANFLNYLGRYTDSIIHRSEKTANNQPFVIQGGGFVNPPDVSPVATDAPVANEFDADNSNLRGTLALALPTGNINGGTSQWFINTGNNASLNSGSYTVFGKVLGDGMNVVDAIHALTSYNLIGATGETALANVPLQNYTPFTETLDGTASVTSGSTTVTGVGTSFLTDLVVGEAVKIGNVTGVVASIANDTTFTLAIAASETVTGGAVKKNALPAENSFVTFSSIATLAVV